MDYLILFLYFFSGLAAVTFLDTVGAITSRKLNFSYNYIVILSAAVYIALAFFVARQFGLKAALVSNAIVGLYDGTVGFWLSITLGGDHVLPGEEEFKELPGRGSAVVMMFITLVLGFAGYGLTFI